MGGSRLTTKEVYELIQAGKYRQVDLMNKIQYWESKKNEAQYYIKRYKKELKKQIQKDG
jgi:hypothetical protein